MAHLIVGLDIGTSAVRAAELDVGPSRPVLVTYGQVGLAPGSIVDGEVADASSVADAITRLWKFGQFSSTSVVVGVAGLRAIIREIDLPYVPDNEVDSAVRFQSEEVIPFPPEQTILSSRILADYTSADGDKMRRVLVAAAHRDLVDGIIAAVERAGLTVEGVDLVSSALVRAISDRTAADQSEAIVSVGAGLTVVVVHQQGHPQFVRTIGSGGNAATAAISGSLDIPISDAEGLKRRIGEQTPQIIVAERAARESISELVGEIRNSIQYFTSLPGRPPLTRVLVTGGGSALYGLTQALAEQVRLPVIPATPLDRLDLSKARLTDEDIAKVSTVLATPIGLALPERDPAMKKFNLLPPEVAKRFKIKAIQQRVLVGAVAVLVLLAGFGAWRYWKVHTAQSSVATLQSTITSLNAEIPRYDLVVAAQSAIASGERQRAGVTTDAVDWPNVIGSLIAITPHNLGVASFVGTTGAPTATTGTPATSTTPKPGSILGTISTSLSGPGPEYTLTSAWINAITSSTDFADPVVTAITTDQQTNVVTFPSTISVTPAASLAKNGSVQ